MFLKLLPQDACQHLTVYCVQWDTEKPAVQYSAWTYFATSRVTVLLYPAIYSFHLLSVPSTDSDHGMINSISCCECILRAQSFIYIWLFGEISFETNTFINNVTYFFGKFSDPQKYSEPSLLLLTNQNRAIIYTTFLHRSTLHSNLTNHTIRIAYQCLRRQLDVEPSRA